MTVDRRRRPTGTEGVDWDRNDFQPALSTDLRKLLERYITEARASTDFPWRFDPKSVAAGREALDLSREDQALLLVYLTTTFTSWASDPDVYFQRLQTALSRRKLPLSEDMLIVMLKPYGVPGSDLAAEYRSRAGRTGYPVEFVDRYLSYEQNRTAEQLLREMAMFTPVPSGRLLSLVEEHIATYGLSASLAAALQSILDGPVAMRSSTAKNRDAVARIQELLGGGGDEFILEPGEGWRDRLLEELRGSETAVRRAWVDVLSHCATATSSRPSKRWLRDAAEAVDAVGRETHAITVAAVIDAAATSESPLVGQVQRWHMTPDMVRQHDAYQNLLRGIVWTAAVNPDARVIASIGAAGVRAYKKIPYHGPRDAKLGNACVWALAHCGELDAIAHLTELRRVVTHKSTRTQLDRALRDAADAFGMSRDEIEEVATPTLDFAEVGRTEYALGDHSALVTVESSGDVTLTWRKPDGKIVKGAPKALREQLPDEVKQVRASVKRIKETVSGVRHRMEQLFIAQRSWTFEAWRSHYLDHPVVGALSRSLIWTIGTTSPVPAIWPEGRPVDVNGTALGIPDNDDVIRLWHPVAASAGDVRDWRRVLFDREIIQPVKQAHREVYLLTDAERETDVYSNRFAAHIVRQHQLRALCQARGWEFSLIGAGFDSHNFPILSLPGHDLSVRFYVDTVTEDVSGPGIYLYLTTDFVDFSGPDGERVPLEQLDPVLFSEVMRDVDLFVSVASVGSDPTWTDGGPNGRFRAYWLEFAEAELSPSAEVRRDVIADLIPRLGKSAAWQIEGKHLVVEGKLHRYRIHLGSGNVMMEPGRYLCIVPAGESPKIGRGRIWLPFEGDRMLSIVLSKALMLSNDDKIEDPTIVAQIGDGDSH